MKNLILLALLLIPASYAQTLIGDGKTDNQTALQEALNTGQPLALPAGEFLHSGILIVSGTSLTGQGSKTILRGTTPNASSVKLIGTGPSISNIKLTYNAKARVTTDTSALVQVQNAKNFRVAQTEMDGSDSVAIMVNNSISGTIVSNTIRNTLADSIHITNKSGYILVEGNNIDKSGDDGIAVVSYERNQLPSHNVTIRGNTVTDNTHARGISVVGGKDVLIENNFVRCAKDYAGIYIASESSYKTLGAKNITVRNNTTESCGSSVRGHDSIMAYTDYLPNDNITITGNTVRNSRREHGVWTFTVHDIAQTNLHVSNNKIIGAKPRPWWKF